MTNRNKRQTTQRPSSVSSPLSHKRQITNKIKINQTKKTVPALRLSDDFVAVQGRCGAALQAADAQHPLSMNPPPSANGAAAVQSSYLSRSCALRWRQLPLRSGGAHENKLFSKKPAQRWVRVATLTTARFFAQQRQNQRKLTNEKRNKPTQDQE